MIFNKIDLMDWESKKNIEILEQLEWAGPSYEVSAATGEGLDQLMKDVM